MNLWDEQQSRVCGLHLWKKISPNLICQCGGRYADSCTDRVTAFGGCSDGGWRLHYWKNKARLLSSTQCRHGEEILQPVVTSNLLQDDGSHRAGLSETISSVRWSGLPATPLIPTEYVGLFWAAVGARVPDNRCARNTFTRMGLNEECTDVQISTNLLVSWFSVRKVVLHTQGSCCSVTKKEFIQC